MNIDGADVVIYGPGRTSLSVLVRSWLDDARLVGIALNPDFPIPVSISIRVATTSEAAGAALAGFNSFRAQIGDEKEREGSLTSKVTVLPDGFNLHDFRAALGGLQYRALAIEDPFPLLIPVVVGICALSTVLQQKITMMGYQKLASECMARGGNPTVIDNRGASVTFDGRVKAHLNGSSSFACVMPQIHP